MKKLWIHLTERPLIKAFLHFYKESDSELTSVAVAYYWLISIFPLIMIAVNILPYFQIPISNFLIALKEFLPDSMFEVIEKIVREVLTQPSTGLLSFSVLSALWTFSKSMDFLQKAFNKAYGVAKNRGLISHQLISLLVSFGLQVLFALALFLSMFGQMLLNFLKNYWQSDSILFDYLQDFTGPIIYILLFAILVMLYYFRLFHVLCLYILGKFVVLSVAKIKPFYGKSTDILAVYAYLSVASDVYARQFCQHIL
mgnify:CR=1 FL=1